MSEERASFTRMDRSSNDEWMKIGRATLELQPTVAERDALKRLTDAMADHWSLPGLTTLLYGIPKLQLGLPITAPPTPELKVLQRSWFILLYQLLIGKVTGPRLPTLLLALGQDRVRSLLTPG